MSQRYLSFVCFLLLSAVLSAQTIADKPELSTDPAALLKYAQSVKPTEEKEVTVLLDERTHRWDEAGRQTETYRLVYRIETPEAVQGWATTTVNWEPWHQKKPTIRARVILPDGRVHLLDQSTLKDSPSRDNTPTVYQDTRVFGGPLPALSVGAIVEEERTVEDEQPYFAGGIIRRHSLGSGAPTDMTRVVLDAPASLQLKLKTYLAPTAKIEKTEANGRVRYTITLPRMEGLDPALPLLPADQPPRAMYEYSTAASWAHVAKTYFEATDPKIRTADVQAMVSAAVKPGDTREQIIRNLTALLHAEVRYTGIEFGEAKIIPQFPSETLKRKYGDCKDKSAMLIAMLRAAGIPAHLVLLSTGPGFDVVHDMPGMGAFDHAIVHVPGEKPVWIDATAEFTQVGLIPYADQGRLALIVTPETKGLTRTPVQGPEFNALVETREFFLAEYGPSRVLEVTEPVGDSEANYRSYFETSDVKEVRKNLESYGKSNYAAETVKAEFSTPRDLTKQFQLRVEALKAARGSSDLAAAAVAVPLSGILNRLPDYLTSDPEKDDEETKQKPARTADFEVQPFKTEWRYKVHVPPGFVVRSLPDAQTEQLGPAELSVSFKSESPELVTGVVRLQLAKQRFSAAEGAALRKAATEVSKRDSLMLMFDLAAFEKLQAGKIREALKEYERLATLHPTEALHRLQIARALLDVGLGDRARKEAKKAVELDPKSALAQYTLGWVLEHDLIGRRFGKGFDHAGAVAAFRKAKELDPKDTDFGAELGILLEHDATGVRYTSRAQLEQAAAEYRAIVAVDADKGHKFDENLLYALVYAGKFKEAREEANKLPNVSDSTKAVIRVAAVAALEGAEAAVKESRKASNSEQARSEALATAAQIVLRMRRYPLAADLLSAAAAGSPNAAQVATQIELFRKTKPYEEMLLPANDVRGVTQRLMFALMTDQPGEKWYHMMSQLVQGKEIRRNLEQLAKLEMRQLKQLAKQATWPPEIMADLTLSQVQFDVEGNDTIGYRVRLKSPGSAAEYAYLRKENGEFKVVNFSSALTRLLALAAHDRLKHNDVAGARKWLDWARENPAQFGGDDPFSGELLPRFWRKGQEADEATVRVAVASGLMHEYLPLLESISVLQAAAAKAEGQEMKNRLDLALARGYREAKKWSELAEVATRLLQYAPDSETAFELAVAAQGGLKKWDAVAQLVAQRTKRLPDDPAAVRALSRSYSLQGDHTAARKAMRPLIDTGRATTEDLNQYSWQALFLPSVDEESVELARQADIREKNNFAIMHTLGCLYSEVGKLKEGRELLLKSMDEIGDDEPNSSVWYGLGRIAELYDDYETAHAAYLRVTKNEDELQSVDEPLATYHLAKKRLDEVQAKLAPKTGSAGGK